MWIDPSVNEMLPRLLRRFDRDDDVAWLESEVENLEATIVEKDDEIWRMQAEIELLKMQKSLMAEFLVFCCVLIVIEVKVWYVVLYKLCFGMLSNWNNADSMKNSLMTKSFVFCYVSACCRIDVIAKWTLTLTNNW